MINFSKNSFKKMSSSKLKELSKRMKFELNLINDYAPYVSAWYLRLTLIFRSKFS